MSRLSLRISSNSYCPAVVFPPIGTKPYIFKFARAMTTNFASLFFFQFSNDRAVTILPRLFFTSSCLTNPPRLVFSAFPWKTWALDPNKLTLPRELTLPRDPRDFLTLLTFFAGVMRCSSTIYPPIVSLSSLILGIVFFNNVLLKFRLEKIYKNLLIENILQSPCYNKFKMFCSKKL